MAGSALMIATEKGLFLLDRDAADGEWDLRGPFCESWPIGHAVQDPETGTMYAAGTSAWHGAGVWRSTIAARPGSCRARALRTRRRAAES